MTNNQKKKKIYHPIYQKKKKLLHPQPKKSKKKKRKRKKGNVQERKKKKKKKKEEATCLAEHQKKKKEPDELSICKCTWAFLSTKQPHFLPSIFSPFWKEIFLVGLGRKHSDPTIYFPSHQTHSKNVFLPIFSPKFSIHHISPPNKHTLRVCLVRRMEK